MTESQVASEAKQENLPIGIEGRPMNSTTPALDSPVWDVVATDCAANDVRWFSVQVALELAAGTAGSVRLFADFAEEIRPDLFTAARNFAKSSGRTPLIYPHRLLPSVSPAKNLLAVFDSIVPGAYLRRASICGHTRARLRLMPLWRTGASPAHAKASTDPLQPLEQGFAGGGIVKPYGIPEVFASPSVSDYVQEVLLDDVRRRTVLLAPTSSTSVERWIDVLSRAPVPTTILLLPSANGISQEKLGLAGRPIGSVRLLTATAKLVVLPSITARELHHCIANAELVLTTSDALALLAAHFGKPAAYFPERGDFDETLQASRKYHSMMLGGESPSIRNSMAKLSVSWKYEVEVDECFRNFTEIWDDILIAAQRGGSRYRAMRSVCDQAQVLGAGQISALEPSREQIKSFSETRPFESIRHAACTGALWN